MIKKSLLLSLLIGVCFLSFGQDKPFSDGTYEFRIFDKEYEKSTAVCKVTITGNKIQAKVIENLLDDIYSKNQIVYKGTLKKIGKYWYIIEPGSLPVSDPDFEFASTRIDFNRRLIIHY
jgi:hypothetical protein